MSVMASEHVVIFQNVLMHNTYHGGAICHDISYTGYGDCQIIWETARNQIIPCPFTCFLAYLNAIIQS